MRPRRLLLRVPAALRRGATGAAAAVLALAIVVPAPATAGDRGATAPGAEPAPVPSVPLPAPPGTTTLVSRALDGGFAGGPSAEPSVSENGRWVAFTSRAPDIVAGDTNNALDVFVRDRRTGTTIRLGLPGGAAVPPGASASQPAISADGSVVAFTYQPAPSFSGALLGTIVLAWERSSGDVEVVSRTTKGGPAQASREPTVSANGRFVAFTSDSDQVVPGDQNESSDVFRYDRRTKTTVLVSAAPGGNAVGQSSAPSMSGNGNLVAFQSSAGDTILFENTGPGSQVYLRDVNAGRTERISGAPGGDPGGGPANGPSAAPAISSDGKFVAFESAASNLTVGDGNQVADVFRRDRTTGTTVLVSVTPSGASAAGPSGEAAISRDGRIVSFTSSAPDVLGTAGLPGAHLAAVAVRDSEVYARDLVAADTILVSVRPNGTPGGGRSLASAIGGNGRFIAFASLSAVIVARDDNKLADAFLRDLPPVPLLNPATVDLGTRAIGAPAVPGAATLANTGWGPLAVTKASVSGGQKAEFPLLADGCAGVTLHRGEACTVTVSFLPQREGPRAATLSIADDFTGSPRTARLRGRGSLARIELQPPVAPPGMVVVASGTGFPPNDEVRLSWSVGLTPKLAIVRTDARGRFRVQVLIFHNDRTGPRDLLARPVDGTSFPPVAAPMLVSVPSTAPPGFLLVGRFIDLPLVLLIRG